jgi:cytochrome c oxidase cbb3-type subunit II
MSILDRHKPNERHATLVLAHTVVVVSIGGLVQIVPLFYLENTIETVEAARLYTPLELTGRDIYVRNDCYGV